MAGGGGGDAGGQRGGRRGGREPARLRERGRRSGERQRVPEWRGPARRRHDCDLDHGRRAGADRARARGGRRAAAERPGRVDGDCAHRPARVEARRRADGGAQAAAAARAERAVSGRPAEASRSIRSHTDAGARAVRRAGSLVERSRGFLAMTGHVSLVGAGPGDPGLMTRLAIARLRRADLVLYDALVDERVLRYARKAQKFFVGKRAGRHALAQPAIETLMIKAARRGRRVVRLKGGDPFVFGRGGEEALALQRAGIPHDIVPGGTSAVAAPAAAGIPVTHRGLASGFAVVAGHDEAAFAATVGSLTPNRLTLVILMGLSRSAALAGQLLDRGWSSGTPAAIVVDAWTADQHGWRGTLGELAADAVDVDRAGAGTIVIGEVVRLGRVGQVGRVG